MPLRHLLPIALPHGRNGATGFLSVYFSPRLKESGRLLDYPEWRNWGQTAATASIQVRVNGVALPAARVVRVSPLPSNARWTALFRPATPVKAHRAVDYAETPILPFASSDFSEAVLALYASIAADHPDNPPSGADVLALPAAANLFAPTGALGQALTYVAPMEGERIEEPEAPSFDFHQYVSLLGHHPELLRHLGVVMDFEIQLPPGVLTSVEVATNYTTRFGPNTREIRIQTRTTPAFLARPNSGIYNEQLDGFLKFAAQGAFLSIVDSAAAIAPMAGVDGRLEKGDDGDLPALATRALTLVRPDLVARFANQTVRQAELEAAVIAQLDGGVQPVVLFAEDVCQGLRPDVLEDGTWRSLFERQTTSGYEFPLNPAQDFVPAPDEGWTTTALVTELVESRPEPPPINDDVPASETKYEPTAQRRLDDALYRWDGWSGAARPPGGAIDGMTGVAVVHESEPLPTDPVQLAVDYRVKPRSLPQLRFGHTYRMRARCVDLAGFSPAVAAPAPVGTETTDETFGRLEPIASPIVVRRTPRPVPGVGDTAESIVLLSDYDIPDKTVAPADRLVFVGRVGQDLCQLHGVPSGGVDAASYQLLADRDPNSPADQMVEDPATGELIAGTLGPRGVIPGATVQVANYLPDPLAKRLRVLLPGTKRELLASLKGKWPTVESARIEVMAGPGTDVVFPAPDVAVRLFVPKAYEIPLDVSLGTDAGLVGEYGLYHHLAAADQAALATAIEHGGHWMFSGRKRLRLVHAVRRPLLAPQVLSLAATRSPSATSATFDGSLTIDQRSTGHFDMTGTWTDTYDDPGAPTPVPRTMSLPLGTLTTAGVETTYTLTALRSELHDTKRHLATITVEAFSRFSQYFTEELTVTPSSNTVVLAPEGVAAGTVQVWFGPERTPAVPGTDFTVDGARGRLRRVAGGAIPAGSRLVVHFVRLPVSRTTAEHDTQFEMIIPNTCPPPPPHVERVVPAFGRTSSASAGTLTGTHDGTTLRVYLARPWMVSGDGERLAVVLDDVTTVVPATSRLGRDPIVAGPGPFGGLGVANFPAATATLDAVTVGGATVDAAAHDVGFDAAQRLWYCDIPIATTVYRPFVQLTLARHQADSIAGAAFSTTITTEPIRLGVVRTVTATPGTGDVEVTVSGPEHAGIPDETAGGALLFNDVVVTLQTADPAIADPDLRWVSTATTVTLTRTDLGDSSTWRGVVSTPGSGDRRLLIEEREPQMRTIDGVLTVVREVVYTETVDL